MKKINKNNNIKRNNGKNLILKQIKLNMIINNIINRNNKNFNKINNIDDL